MKQQQQKDHNHKAELKLHQGNRLEKKKKTIKCASVFTKLVSFP